MTDTEKWWIIAFVFLICMTIGGGLLGGALMAYIAWVLLFEVKFKRKP